MLPKPMPNTRVEAVNKFLEQMIESCDSINKNLNSIESKSKKLKLDALQDYSKTIKGYFQNIKESISGYDRIDDIRIILQNTSSRLGEGIEINDSADFIKEYVLCSICSNNSLNPKDLSKILERSGQKDNLKLDYLKLLAKY